MAKKGTKGVLDRHIKFRRFQVVPCGLDREYVEQIETILSNANIKMPGNGYDNDVSKPDILCMDEIPFTSTKDELFECLQYYNKLKFKVYQQLCDGIEIDKARLLVREISDVNWGIIMICRGILKKYATRNDERDLPEIMQSHMCKMVGVIDRYDPRSGYTPSTYIISSVRMNASRINYSKQNENLLMYTSDIDTSMGAIWYHYDVDYAGDADRKDISKLVVKMLDDIKDDRSRDIMKRRFFDDMTYDNIGKLHGITKERVRQILVREIDNIRSKYSWVESMISEEIVC